MADKALHVLTTTYFSDFFWYLCPALSLSFSLSWPSWSYSNKSGCPLGLCSTSARMTGFQLSTLVKSNLKCYFLFKAETSYTVLFLLAHIFYLKFTYLSQLFILLQWKIPESKEFFWPVPRVLFGLWLTSVGIWIDWTDSFFPLPKETTILKFTRESVTHFFKFLCSKNIYQLSTICQPVHYALGPQSSPWPRRNQNLENSMILVLHGNIYNKGVHHVLRKRTPRSGLSKKGFWKAQNLEDVWELGKQRVEVF